MGRCGRFDQRETVTALSGQRMKRILVVDDSSTIRQQVSLALIQAGFVTVEAVDGIDALAKVDATIAMMVCDVNMPRMGGLELIEQINRDAKLAGVPIVMLTT